MNLDTDLQIATIVILGLSALAFVQVVATELARRRVFERRILVLGWGRTGTLLIDELESGHYPNVTLLGVIADEKPATPSDTGRWLGTCDVLSEVVERLKPSVIVLAVRDRRHHLPLVSLLETRVRGTDVQEAHEVYEKLTGKMAIESLTPTALILGKGFRNHLTAHTARVISATAATTALALIAPLLAMLAVLIKLTSKGPVFFVQERAGQNGRPFPLLKLRTMHECNERPSEWVQDNEDRITTVGRWLRRFRLDELPQLVNVVRGDMNLIGPRPHPTRNQAIFMEHIAYYGLRSSIPPGITGWAQVRYGYANNLEEETEKMRYDLYYIKNRSMWLDTWILIRTIGMVFLGRGATGVRQPATARRQPVRPQAWSPLT